MNGFAVIQTNAQSLAPQPSPPSHFPFMFTGAISRAFLFDFLIMKFTKGSLERFSRGIVSLTDCGLLNYLN